MDEERRTPLRGLETALVFGAWTFFGLILAQQGHVQSELRGEPLPLAAFLRFALLDSCLWALATLAIFGLARRFPLERGQMHRSIPVHLVGAVGHSLLRMAIMFELGRRVEWIPERSFERLFWGGFHQYLLFYTFLLGIAHARFYYGRYRERERAAERLATGLAEARLHALKMQMQPHFPLEGRSTR